LKNNNRILLAALFVFAPLMQLRAADAPAVFTNAASVLPQVKDLGPEWYWPWNTPRQYTFAAGDTNDSSGGITERDWRNKFNHDPRGPLLSQAYQIEEMSDQDFKDSLGLMAALFGVMADTNSPAGMELSGGGAISNALGQAQSLLTRTQMVAELKAQALGIKDWASNDYNRSKPNGKKSDIPGYVPTDDDNLTLELTLYTEDYLGARKTAFDLDEANLKKAVEERRRTKAMVQQALENQLDELSRSYEAAMMSVQSAETTLRDYRTQNQSSEVIENQTKYVEDKKKTAAVYEKEINRIVSRNAKVNGAMLQGVDGGYLVSELETDTEGQSATIYGKLRRGAAVVEVSRLAQGAYAAGALDDTLRVLNLLSTRLNSLTTPSAEQIQFNAGKTMNYDFKTDAGKVPEQLKNKTNAPPAQ
jgi:hypothetical protein